MPGQDDNLDFKKVQPKDYPKKVDQTLLKNAAVNAWIEDQIVFPIQDIPGPEREPDQQLAKELLAKYSDGFRKRT
jgi:hypothetical protein